MKSFSIRPWNSFLEPTTQFNAWKTKARGSVEVLTIRVLSSMKPYQHSNSSQMGKCTRCRHLRTLKKDSMGLIKAVVLCSSKYLQTLRAMTCLPTQ